MKNEYLRHILATIKYRLKKSLMYSDSKFEKFSLGKGSRNPIEILIHMNDVLNWAIKKTDHSNKAMPIPTSSNGEEALTVFLKRLDFFDDMLAEKELDSEFTKKLLQGPLADILTHIGQIAMLSRINNNPIEGEDFSKAQIKTGIKES